MLYFIEPTEQKHVKREKKEILTRKETTIHHRRKFPSKRPTMPEAGRVFLFRFAGMLSCCCCCCILKDADVQSKSVRVDLEKKPIV